MLLDISLVVTLLCCYGAKVAEARNHGNLRLVGSTDYRNGRVEIYIEPNNTWGIVCDDHWDDADARVVCRQLGFGNSGTAVQTHSSSESFSNGPIWLDDVECTGHEQRLIDCPHNGLENHNCDHFENAGVTCEGTLPKLPVRLAGGSTIGEGRVEILYKNSWATVCDDRWDDNDASTVCRQLGLGSSGSAVRISGFGQGTGTILLDEVRCATGQSNIFECRHNGFENHDCSHIEDAGVRCNDSHSNIVRLVGSSSYNEGRVEVFYNGQWGTVCDDGWGTTDAGVVCRQLGFGSSGRAIHLAGFGQGSGSIWLDSVTCIGNESTLASCGHLGVGVTRSCSHSEDAGVICSGTQVVPVRLSNGDNSRSGRVEMYINGQWGTVCDDGWTTRSSVVVCRQLGLGNIGTFNQFGSGPLSYPIHLDNVICGGNEANILTCQHLRLGLHDCGHHEDTGIICSGLYNAPIRLRDGGNNLEGRVEIMYQGIWGTICDDGWDDIDATVVCRELGYSHGNATRQAQFGSGSGPVWLRQVGCNGNESKLSHCTHTGASNILGCSHAQDVGVQCYGVNVRLVNGPTEYEGRVEVNYNGEWGTVCDDDWDLNDAQVVCNELGLGKATAAQHRAFYGQGTGEIWLDNVNCVGNEWTIGNCSHRGWGIDDCGHFEDASVNCTAVGPVDNGTLRLVGSNLHTEGGVQIFNGSQWVEVCDDGWDATEAGVVCRQLGFGSSGTIRRFRGSGSNEAIIPPSYSCSGNESMLLNCSLRGIQPSDCDRFENVEVECQAPVPALPIRLADGGRPYSGRVEVYRNGVWGTVCDDNWTDMTAQVVCQQLGFGNTSASVDFDVPAGTGPILMDDINCNNGQTNLLACSHNGFGNHNCLHSEDVGVRCLQPSSRPLIRLVGSSSYNEGRVEVNYNGEWGTVCDDGWDDTDAGVVCRQLGFGSSGTAIGSAGFGQGSGSIWLDSVTCTGSESTLAECGHAGISVTGLCTHNNDAGVRCFGGQGVSVRLVGGNSYNEGRVEVNYDGEWGTVCDDGWDDTDAGVVCRQLGFGSSGTAINRAHQTGFGRGSGSILLDNIFCTGNESTLASCGHLGVGVTRSCSHSEDAGVRCSEGTFGSLIRLVGGSSYNEGRVEVNYNGEWGTVCDDGWDDTDAGAVCRQLGFGSSGTAIGSAAFGQGSESIWLDGVSCSGNELALAACGHLGVGITRNCSHLSDAGIRCIGRFYFPIRIQHLEQGKVTGRVEMLSNGQWGLVCANDWDMRDAMVACQDALLGNNGTTIKYPHSQTEKLFLSGVDCMGNESQLSLCPHNGIGVVEECALVAGVECFVSPAIVSIIPNNHSVNLYESVAFFCSAIGRGSFSFAWEHNGMVISSSDSLSIDSVMPQDQGQYKCTVTTTFSNFSINSNASAMLNLNAPSFDSQTLLQQVTSSTSANTITISIPQIDDSSGPISHYYIVVSVEQLEDTEAVKDSELLPANLVKRNADLPLYVTASVNYEDFQPTFIIGDGSSSTDPISQTTFHNIPLQKDSTYYYFIRAYSVAHSAQYPFFGTSKLSSAIAIRPEDSAITGASSKSSPSPAPAIAGVVVAVIVIIGIAVCVVLAVIMIRRKKGKKFNFTRSQNGSNINNPTYSSAPSASNALATKNINDDPTLLEPDDHIYEPICHGSQLEKEKHLQKANHKAASNIYYNTSQKPNNNDDDDDDRLSIKSDDVKYDDTEEQRTSNVKKSTARYSKNGKPKPQPKPRHSKQPTANTTAPTVHYDVPRSSLQLVDEGDYTALDLTRSNAMNNGNDYQQLAINGGNDYQELMAHQPPPPGYSVPNNIPATSTTLESHVRSSS